MSIFKDIYVENENGDREYKILINGCWDCYFTTEKIEVRNPSDNKIVGYVPNCTEKDIETAIDELKEYKKIENYTPIERLEIMERAYEILLGNKDEVAKIITQESGKPISVSLGEVSATAERLKLTLQEVRALYGEYIAGEWVHDTQNKFAIVMRKPIGVVASISSFNYPLYIAAAKIIPAILAGNTVIAKPSSDTPITLIYFAKILEEAGLPKKAFSIVTGSGRKVGDALIQNRNIAAITFTGSTNIGMHIAKSVDVKKLHLELGGKASAIVLKDSNLENAVKHIVKGTFRNSGQRCDAVSRVLIEKEIKNEFIEKVLEESKKYKLGDPLDKKTQVGPVINKKAIERVDRLVKDAIKKGAKLIIGGKYNDLFYEPTILDNVTLDMDIAWEEIFGPVMPIIEVNNYEEAIEISNKSEYGLDSCVFTENINIALKIGKALEDGTVSINSAPGHGVGHFPFGGNKKSGIGREGLKYSIDELTKLHTIVINQI
ncbi:aldehyde dehydrogenase family protein [Haliovirga abyssi]|uniref:NADP-dependent glyceraldehyde-3-phosphate dehydrogenase n=1 Tax=Haliovirga abyssi TaxID=2996794 RepID=A0AAU9E295_9FUSO|nr:aldehyde dehydrogenase family protein [Haliovirga abyssi]BDU50520.1 NADP-dependent glyceraldehyde-3-phosphate dehydrogenase [Haliovirga abyssi]